MDNASSGKVNTAQPNGQHGPMHTPCGLPWPQQSVLEFAILFNEVVCSSLLQSLHANLIYFEN